MDTKLIAKIIKTKSVEEIQAFLDDVMKYAAKLLADMLIDVVVAPIIEEEEPTVVEEYSKMGFHHTQTDGPDGGQSLVMCPGETEKFDRCECNGVAIRYHGLDNGRLTYWSMFKSGGSGYIVCKKGSRKYRFKTEKGKIINGSCR